MSMSFSCLGDKFNSAFLKYVFTQCQILTKTNNKLVLDVVVIYFKYSHTMLCLLDITFNFLWLHTIIINSIIIPLLVFS